jgi:hypothetical protein
MKRLVPLVIRPWMLPLIVAALVVPIVAGFAVAGPPLGLALGAVAVAALLIVAATARYDEPIVVVPSSDLRYRLLVVAAAAVADPARVAQITANATEGTRAIGGTEPPLVHVLVPLPLRRLDRWASDLGGARDRAAGALAASLAAFGRTGMEVTGSAGDANPVQAVGDLLAEFPAREVVIVDADGIGPQEAEEVGRRLDRPVRLLDPQANRPTSSA